MELGGGRVKKERENRVAMKMVREKMAATVRVIILIGGIKTQSSVAHADRDRVDENQETLYCHYIAGGPSAQYCR